MRLLTRNDCIVALRLAPSALLAAGLACLLWRAGTEATAYLSGIALSLGLAAGLLWVVGIRKEPAGSRAAPVVTERQLQALDRQGRRGLMARTAVIVAALLAFATGITMSFPGRISALPVLAAVLAAALSAGLGALTARGRRGWGLDAVIPDAHLRARLTGQRAIARYLACWTLAGRLSALREAAALHPEAPAAAGAILRAQYAPSGVSLSGDRLHKSLGDELRLRLIGGAIVGWVAAGAAVVALLLALMLPAGLWPRWDAVSPRADLSELPRDRSPDAPPETQPPPQGPAAPSAGGAGGGSGDEQDGQGQGGSGATGGDGGSSGEAGSTGGDSGGDSGAAPGSSGSGSAGARGADGGAGAGDGTGSDSSPDAGATSGAATGAGAGGSDGSEPGPAPGPGQDGSAPEGPADTGAGPAPGGSGSEATPSAPDSAVDPGATPDASAPDGPRADTGADRATGGTSDAGDDEEAPPGGQDPATRSDAEGDGGAVTEVLPDEAEGPGDGSVSIDTDLPSDPAPILQDTGPSGVDLQESGAPIQVGPGTEAAGSSVGPTLSVGAQAQLFAEQGAVPDAVVLDLPIAATEAVPDPGRPDPPRQLLPAWINELVN